MTKTKTVMVYSGEHLSQLYNKIMEAYVNVEDAERRSTEQNYKLQYDYHIKKRLFRKPLFQGTFEEFKAFKNYDEERMKRYFKRSRPLRRLNILSAIVSEAIAYNLTIHFSLSDYTFVEKCLTKSESEHIFYNASYD